MGKYYGAIGYAETKEIPEGSGIWEEVFTEKNYSGEVIKNTSRWQSAQTLNDNLTINNQISIIADAFATMNFHSMRYIKWMGASWKITLVDVQRPRLILTIGGVYNV